MDRMKNENRTTLIVVLSAAGAIITIMLLLLAIDYDVTSYLYVAIAASAAYLVFAFLIFRIELEKRHLYFLLIIFFVARIFFLFSPPLGSKDVYRYLWDGKVFSAGVNPYKFAPNDAQLIELQSEKLPSEVTFKHLKTIYFPAAQILFLTAYNISGEEIWGTKILILLFEILLLLSALKFLPDKQKKFMLLYFAAPLTIIQFAVDAHLDAFGFAFMVLSIFLFEKKKYKISFALLAFAVLIKPAAAVIFPFYLFYVQGWKSKIINAALFIAVSAGTFIPFSISANPVDSIFLFTERWVFNGALYSLMNIFIGDYLTVRIICGLTFAAIYALIFFSKFELREKIFYSMLFLLLCSPIVHPWYVGWLAALLILNPMRSGIVFVALVSLTSITVYNFETAKIWKEYPIVLMMEYIPVFFFLLREIRLRTKEREFSAVQK